ncbi:hypothetical protein ANO14919_097690 [Xylariales sp. No.14919]|nr:hypothetical protein ANO14919_097690 [Xylariales sp. No.14919]
MSRDESTTIQNHLLHHIPRPNWSEDRQWDWPFSKFGFPGPDILFTDLHTQFNSVPCAIQDPYGWYFDVCDIANEAQDRAQFYTLLKKRQEERFAELRDAWETTKSRLAGQPSRWEVPRDRDDLWLRFIRISRNFSYDAILGYFGSYAENELSPVQIEAKKQREARRAEHKRNNPNATREPSPGLIPLPESLREDFLGVEPPSQENTIPAAEPSMQESTSLAVELPRQRSTSPKQAAEAKLSRRTTGSPNKVVKRRTRRNKAAGGNPEPVRRSARLQQRAEREKR